MDKALDEPEAPFGLNHGPMLTGAFAPISHEEIIDTLDVEGTIPTDLNGVYLRNGPNPRHEPKGSYHVFDGDGMLHSAEFRGGKVVYRNKWIRTEGWLQNEESGEERYWGVINTVKGNPDRPMNDVANTDVVGHAGYAVVSWYLCGTPYLVDPMTLETVRSAPDYVAGPGQGMSAHTKVDEYTGDMMFFDYFNEAPYMTYGVVNAQGKLVHHVPIELPGSRLMHDMAVTENHSILHDVPVYHQQEAQEKGRHKIRFDSSLPMRFGVIPRFGQSNEVRWFDFTPCFVYHVVNSWEEGDEVVMVLCRYMPTLHADGTIDEIETAKRIGRLKMDARLWRYRMNVKTGECSEECLNPDLNVEFPGYNSAETGRYTKWGYLIDHDPEILRWTGLRKFNLDTGESVAEWSDDPDHCWYSEPWFAPADEATAEDDGYVIVFCWNDATRLQEMQVFDARKISEGPVARIKLPHRLPPGFHACWMKPEQIASWSK
ncbi:Lignostilbene-alpha,beta-dioxygenase isozyme I [Pseudovibrio axinellae]|uniref:Dioxygenase n=1 Tax=Pseudovibrio axinellae TaxID=989403 RepID=A0A161V502_9HYPH|nr:carotenoid oxygenase family protein [Pseudovibrio axinellae]KZL19870.1 Lignostilbene-alpha,beta-dioxygenase isozyme I [Pseudovibrio axinellae]SER38659.1 carotenoid cleavage dioxygenase [Pseudovibrio axinellae]